MSFLNDKIRTIEKLKISDDEKKKKIDILTKRLKKVSAEKRARDSKLAVVAVMILVPLYIILFNIDELIYCEDIMPIVNVVLVIALFAALVCLVFLFKPVKHSKHSRLKNIQNEEIENLKNFFQQLYVENEEELKKGRLKLFLWYLALIALFAVPLIASIVIAVLICRGMFLDGKDFSYFENMLAAGPYVLVLAAFVGVFIQDMIHKKIYSSKRAVKQIYKKEMLSEFLRYVNTGLKYSEELPVASSLESDFDFLEYGKMFNESYVDNIDDYFSGYVGDKYIEMADVKFVSDIKRESFNGRFASISVPNFTGDVDIIAKTKKGINGLRYAKTGVYKFDKHFCVSRAEEKELFTIFDKYFLEFLGDFAEKTGIVFDLLVKDKIYIKFYVGNIFEPKMFGKMIDEYSMYKFVMIMNLLRELAERL